LSLNELATTGEGEIVDVVPGGQGECFQVVNHLVTNDAAVELLFLSIALFNKLGKQLLYR
jgi:hypothetical protein